MDGSKFLSQDERSHFETTLRDRIDSDLRNCTMLLVALHSGARANELLALEWKDFDLRLGEIRLATLKGGRPRVVVVPKYVREALTKLKATSPDKPFDLSYSRLVEVWYLYRPSRKPLRCLRHTFAQRCYERTKDLRFTQSALGHRNIQNTMIYAEYSHNANEFRKLMKVR